MKEYTRYLINEANADKTKMGQFNNSKADKRTPEQRKQSHDSRVKFFSDKWNELLEKCETDAQINICKEMLERTKNIRMI